MQKFVKQLAVRKGMGEYVELTNELYEASETVNPDKLMEVAFYALMALQVLQNDVFIEPEMDEIKEKVVFFLSDALEEAGFELCT